MDKIIAYLKKHTGAEITRSPVADTAVAGLPNVIRFQYRVEQWKLYEVDIIAMMPIAENMPPGVLIRHAEIVKVKTGKPVVLVFDELPAYVRQRLAAKQQSFVVTDRQIFLPQLMLLTTKKLKITKVAPDYLSAPAQLLVLSYIQNGETGQITGQNLSHRFGGSAMTWSRALSELVGLALGEEANLGKFRYFRFLFPPGGLWDMAKPFLRTPVQKTFWIQNFEADIQWYTAGLSALAQFTDLSAPDNPVIAISNSVFQKVKKAVHFLPWPEENSVSMQIWRYDPGAVSHAKSVDPLSLYLSFRDDHDERVAKAREQLIKGTVWSRG